MAWQLEGPIQSQQFLQPQEPLTTRILQEAKRIGAGAGLSALKGLETLFVDLPGLVGIKPPAVPGEKEPVIASKLIQQLSGKPTEYFEPQSLPEQFIQRFSTFAPLAISGGIGALGRTAAGSGVATALGALGAPEGLQDIAQLGTELGLGRIVGRIPSMKQAQKIEDSLARASVGKNTLVKADSINKALQEVEQGLLTETSQKYSKKINHALKKISNNLTQNTINPTNAMDIRASLYKLQQELPKNVNAKYIQPLTEGINDFFATYAAENPTFYKHLKARDQLTTLRNMNGIGSRFMNKLELNKLPGGQFATDIINKITDEGERFVRGIVAKNPAARTYYFNAITAAAEDNPALFIKNITKLSPFVGVEKYKIPQELQKPYSQWVLE